MHLVARTASYIIDTAVRLIAGISLRMWLQIIIIVALLVFSQR